MAVTYERYGEPLVSATMTALVTGETGFDKLVIQSQYDNVDAATVPATATVTAEYDSVATGTLSVGPKDMEVAVGDSVAPIAGVMVVEPGATYRAKASASGVIIAHGTVQKIPRV